MDIKFKCPFCYQPLEASHDMADSWINCPSCQQPIHVPLPFEEMKQQVAEKKRKKEAAANLQDTLKIIGICLFPFAILGGCIAFELSSELGCSQSKHSSGSSSSSIASLLNKWTHTTEDCWGWQDVSDYDKATKLLASGDQRALKNHWNQQVMAGTATMISAGTKVFVEDRSAFAGRVLIRPEGSIQSYWVVEAALK